MEQLAETPLGIVPRSKAWDKLKEADIDPVNNIKILETSIEVWEKDPDKPRYLRFVRRKSANELWKEVKTLLPHYVPQWNEYFENLGVATIIRLDKMGDLELPKYHHVACYVVRGSNEGHYLHCDLILPEDKRHPLFVGKTLLSSTQIAWETAQAFSLILED